MNLRKLILTKNECYIRGAKIKPRGIMVHSTGANNPNLSRYVGPDDGLLGKNAYNNHWNTYRPSGIQVCVHAFIGKLKDGSIATYQTLPWDHRGWHAGKDAGNSQYIGFEICEDNLKDRSYFDKVYQEAVELCAYLCKLYKLDPIKNIICHSEGYTKGVASAHGDVMHWFPKHGKNMDTFRAAVKAEMEGGNAAPAEPETKPGEKQLYRVRKSWADAKTQIGAFGNLKNAKAMADKNPGYKVYNNNGNQVYPKDAAKSYLVRVEIRNLNIRRGPGTSYGSNGFLPPGVYTIVDEQNGFGKLKSGAGWISLDYAKKI